MAVGSATQNVRHMGAAASAFAKAAVLAAGLVLVAATDLMGQSADLNHAHRSIMTLATPGAGVCAGNVLVRVDSVSSSAVHISLSGPNGVFSKAEPLLLNVWKSYNPGGTELFIKATHDGNGKEVFIRVWF